jgi:glycerate kinase
MRGKRLHVLIVPDKFKGTMTARQAADAMARGWRRSRPGDRLTTLPATDGGDGFGAVMGGLLGARRRFVTTQNAAHVPCRSPWWWEPRHRIAVVESAAVIGLAMLPKHRFHPFELDTLGLGGLLQSIAKAQPRSCLIGVGGSATNDGGFGLALALGWKFFRQNGTPLRAWTELVHLARIEPPSTPWLAGKIVVALDVRNGLLGPRGATRVYGPQKGLQPEELMPAEACLRRLAAVWQRQFGSALARRPGAGAAGGLGFALMAFLGAHPRSGIEVFAEHATLDSRIQAADLVLTGEGSLDRSSLMGKGVGEIARRCRQWGKPCLGLSGVTDGSPQLRRAFESVHALVPEFTTTTRALTRPRYELGRLARRIAALIR